MLLTSNQRSAIELFEKRIANLSEGKPTIEQMTYFLDVALDTLNSSRMVYLWRKNWAKPWSLVSGPVQSSSKFSMDYSVRLLELDSPKYQYTYIEDPYTFYTRYPANKIKIFKETITNNSCYALIVPSY